MPALLCHYCNRISQDYDTEVSQMMLILRFIVEKAGCLSHSSQTKLTSLQDDKFHQVWTNHEKIPRFCILTAWTWLKELDHNNDLNSGNVPDGVLGNQRSCYDDTDR